MLEQEIADDEWMNAPMGVPGQGFTNKRVSLGPRPHDRQGNEWKPSRGSFYAKAAPAVWRARRGYMMHRPQSILIKPNFSNEPKGYHLTAHWWCGNMSHEPLPVQIGCEQGLKPCVGCEVRWKRWRVNDS